MLRRRGRRGRARARGGLRRARRHGPRRSPAGLRTGCPCTRSPPAGCARSSTSVDAARRRGGRPSAAPPRSTTWSSAAAAGARPWSCWSSVADPGNAGTVIRSAEAAGCAGRRPHRGSVDPYNPKAVRATAGSMFRLPVARGARSRRRSTPVERGGVADLGDGRRRRARRSTPSTCRAGRARGRQRGPRADRRRRPAACSVRCRSRWTGRSSRSTWRWPATVLLFEAARQRRSGAEPTSRRRSAVGHNEIGHPSRSAPADRRRGARHDVDTARESTNDHRSRSAERRSRGAGRRRRSPDRQGRRSRTLRRSTPNSSASRRRSRR